MEAHSYIENIANRTTMRGVIATMTRIIFAGVVVLAVTLAVGTGFHPAASILALIMLGVSIVLGRDAVILGRQIRAQPLDLAFEPAPDRGLLSPSTIFGVAGGIALFSVTLAIVTFVAGADMLVWSVGGLLLSGVIAAVGLPTLGVRERRWRVLADTLRARPDMIEYLQDARARFPKSAPFPFEAPTDQVRIP